MAGKSDEELLRSLGSEAGLSTREARVYLNLLKDGSMPKPKRGEETTKLMALGMVIVSGDDKMIIPVHPRLGIANHYRTWREAVVREINERRLRTDKLILELIPLYEAATEKRMAGRGKSDG